MPRLASSPRTPDIAARVAALDWDALAASLDAWGYARTPPVLTRQECEDLVALYGDEARFRSRIDMERYRFGVGDYKYFAAPLPPLVAALREALYPPL
ncbi:MAG TPA: prolyl 4-hydroxylase subunit alpha, partial [Candidatus Tectomicrobia bacterium]|nr:prolyl 4-hydroxylase subunit alpha [Candidatus Tectomicrobia bacterium]